MRPEGTIMHFEGAVAIIFPKVCRKTLRNSFSYSQA